MISHETFNMICWIWIAAGLITFPILLKVPQPYGRHSKSNWGPMINNRIGWFIMELPALLVFGYFVSFTFGWQNQLVLVAASLWVLHYFHRVFIFPIQIKTGGKKIPLIIALFAILFNTMNGFLNGYWLAYFASECPSDVYVNMRQIAGTLIFLAGFAINKYHDRILIQLRKSSGHGYHIPYGGLFKSVSCPNFLGESIAWFGFFIVTFGLPAFAFLVWTLINLIPRALDHHKWYRNKFPDYPKSRKAIIPYLL
jgi:3-oxo-5-alpha-steroid 4-dehydrogenase 1